MSADDLGADLEGLLSDLSNRPAKKAAAKRSAKKATARPEPTEEAQEVPEVPNEPTPPIAEEAAAEVAAEADPTPPAGTYATGGYVGSAGNPTNDVVHYNYSAPELTLAELKEQLRAEVMAEVLAEFKAERQQAKVTQNDRLLDAIGSQHKGTAQQTGNPLALPQVPEGTELPKLVHFVEDGFTINGTRAFRGQEYEPTRHDAWAALTPREQVKAYGRVMFRVGPWEGASFDLDDPALSEDDRQKLAAIAADRYANRLRVEPLTEVGSRRY